MKHPNKPLLRTIVMLCAGGCFIILMVEYPWLLLVIALWAIGASCDKMLK